MKKRYQFLLALLLLHRLCVCAELGAMEQVRWKTKIGTENEQIGRILLKGPQGEFVLQARDGRMFQITPDAIVSQETHEEPFAAWTDRELEPRLAEEFGPEFHILKLDHYLLVYNTSESYAEWYGTYFDRFYDKYHAVWKKFGLTLAEPEFPLVAVLFSDKNQFDEYAKKEIGDGMSLDMSAYYHKWTNRIVLCDLSGREKLLEDAPSSKRLGSSSTRDLLNRPGSGHNLSAMLHEAAHQIGCNNGMFPRLAPVPLWLLEGVAMLHEIPDVDNPKRSESGEPSVNKKWLGVVREFFRKNPSDPVRTMLQTDIVLRSQQTAKDYYGLSWSFTYFLYKKKPKQFAAYLQTISAKTAADVDSPTLRLLDFEEHFGDDWDKLQKEYARYIRSLK